MDLVAAESDYSASPPAPLLPLSSPAPDAPVLAATADTSDPFVPATDGEHQVNEVDTPGAEPPSSPSVESESEGEGENEDDQQQVIEALEEEVAQLKHVLGEVRGTLTAEEAKFRERNQSVRQELQQVQQQ